MIGGIGGGGSSSVMTMAQMQQADMQEAELRALKMAGTGQSTNMKGQLGSFLNQNESGYLDPYGPLKKDMTEGGQEMIDRHNSTDAERQQSRQDYASGEHGLGTELINQGLSNAKENIGNSVTGITTGAKTLWDVGVEAPARSLHNAGKAVVDGSKDAGEPIAKDLNEGRNEIIERHESIDQEREASRKEYAAGERGLGTELISQGWCNLKENVGNTGTALKTGGKLLVDGALAPARFLWNTTEHLFNAR